MRGRANSRANTPLSNRVQSCLGQVGESPKTAVKSLQKDRSMFVTYYCCSITSLTRIAYGSVVWRQGKSRPFPWCQARRSSFTARSLGAPSRARSLQSSGRAGQVEVMTSNSKGELPRMLTREERFNGLHERNFEAIRRYALRRAPALADDIVSETFLVAWRRIDDVPDDERPWLFGVARNARLNLERSRRRQQAVVSRLAADPADSTDEADGRRETVAAALSSLSERDRELLLLHAWEGLNRREIAAVVGCSVANVSVRLHRARSRFAAALAVEPRQAHAPFPLINGGAPDVL